ncbi:MAG: response regulator [Deltaproteobacteria bacterium]|nr:response regulator [Deltaproteobacteria bacterium]
MKKLLLADDSITIQKVVGIIFATEDFELTMTDDGDSAFVKALEQTPDLVIADVSMPGKDGFELCRAIKNEPSLRHTSVMLLPGAFDHFDEVKAQEVCADGWLTKPFESQALLDKVAQLLEAEPVPMAGGAATVVEDLPPASEETEPGPVDDQGLDESVLGLDDMDELSASAAETEDSPDDIWDAVSFEEDDLQPEEDDTEKGEEEGTPFAAVSFDSSVEEPETQVEGSVAETLAEENPAETETPKDDFEVADLVEQTIEEDLDFTSETEAASDPESEFESFVFGANPDSEPLPQEESASEIEDGETSLDDANEVVDFSTFNEEQTQYPAEEPVAEEDHFVPTVEEEEPRVLTEEGAEEQESRFVDPAVSFVGDEASEHLELTDEETLAPIEDFPVLEDEPAAVEDFILDDAIEEPLDSAAPAELEPEFAGSSADTDAVMLEEDPDEVILELAEEDEVLDLSEDDIVEEQPAEELDEAVEDVQVADFKGPLDESSPDSELDEPEDDFVEAETAFESVEDDALEPEADHVEEIVAETAEVQEEVIEELDEFDVQPEMVEDDGFYFDASAEEAETDSVAATVAGIATGAVATTTLGADDLSSSSVAQVEQQLRELTEDELKEVVANVAGPMIEKMAGELIEQIAWEVVPDLAEAIIKEEIRKIKQAISN